tara:strand:- start:400 stop:573 length:174 start_codon:yes stop_codon:yes gene_type:complete
MIEKSEDLFGEPNPVEYYVDFSSITIDEDTYKKLTNDPQFASQWIIDNAEIDGIVRA